MVFAQARVPLGVERAHRTEHVLTAAHLHVVALTVVDAQRLDALKVFERPGEARRRILPARKEDERAAAARGMVKFLHE